MRGLGIAEGDILVLSIRTCSNRDKTAVEANLVELGLTMELLQGKYKLPSPMNPDSLLARHEAALFAELSSVLSSSTHHRDAEVTRRILPRCQSFVEAIGHRITYDAATRAGVPSALVDMYVADVVQSDGAWYAEELGIGRADQIAASEAALDAILPLLQSLIDELGAKPYLNAPILTDEAWDAFEAGLPVFGQTEVAQTSSSGQALQVHGNVRDIDIRVENKAPTPIFARL